MTNTLLNYKTKISKQSPQGKPKVFFTCHEEDFDKYFEVESNAILWSDNNIDCAVWYNNDIHYYPDSNEEKEEYCSLIYDMNMFVIPITLNFLKVNNRAYDIDFKYAFTYYCRSH